MSIPAHIHAQRIFSLLSLLRTHEVIPKLKKKREISLLVTFSWSTSLRYDGKTSANYWECWTRVPAKWTRSVEDYGEWWNQRSFRCRCFRGWSIQERQKFLARFLHTISACNGKYFELFTKNLSMARRGLFMLKLRYIDRTVAGIPDNPATLKPSKLFSFVRSEFFFFSLPISKYISLTLCLTHLLKSRRHQAQSHYLYYKRLDIYRKSKRSESCFWFAMWAHFITVIWGQP